jgi:hypothetical protein
VAELRQPKHLRLIGKLTAALIAGVLLSLNVYASTRAEPDITVSSGRYGSYYHMQFDLTAAGIDFDKSDKAASSGGQFELRLKPEYFPIPAPHCTGALILRMPWTAPDVPQADAKVAAKKALLAHIWGLARNPDARVSVELELNPYVEIISRSPLRLQLTECNVFFRQAFGGYVDYSGPLH